MKNLFKRSIIAVTCLSGLSLGVIGSSNLTATSRIVAKNSQTTQTMPNMKGLSQSVTQSQAKISGTGVKKGDNLVIKTSTAQVVDLSNLPVQDQKKVFDLYKKDGWSISADGTTLTKNVNPSGQIVSVNGQNYQTDANGEASANIDTSINNGQAAISVQGNSYIKNTVNGKVGNSNSVKLNKGQTQTVTVNSTGDVNGLISAMDAANNDTSTTSATMTSVPLNQAGFSIGKAKVFSLTYIPSSNSGMVSPMGYQGQPGYWVGCNDFNGPLSNGYHYDGYFNGQKYVNFLGSDCYYSMQKWINCWTHSYCVGSNWGICSIWQGMPRTFHWM